MRQRSRPWILVAIVALVLALLASAACRGKEQSASQPTAAATGTGGTEPLRASDVGVTETEIVLGAHIAMTGPAAQYRLYGEGGKAYFDYVNQELGGVNGRKIVYKLVDDGYEANKAVAAVKQLVDSDKVFAVFQGLGTSSHAAVVDFLNERQVPDMFVRSGASKFNDPARYPWTFQYTFSYVTDGEVMAEYVAKNYPGKKIGILYQNDDFGKDYLNAFTAKLGSAGTVVSKQSFEVAAPDVSSQLQQIRNAGAEVVMLFATPKFAALALKWMAQGGWNPVRFMSVVAADQTTIKNAGAAAAEGTFTTGYYGDLEADTTNPHVQLHKRIMAKYAPGIEPSDFTLTGHAAAELMVEVLKRAGRNPTRQSLIKAAESIRDFKDTAALGPATMTSKDHAPLHCERFKQVKGGKFVYISDLVCAPVKGLQQ